MTTHTHIKHARLPATSPPPHPQEYVAVTQWGDRSYKRLAVAADGRVVVAYADLSVRDATYGVLRVVAWQAVSGRLAWWPLGSQVTDRAINTAPGLAAARNGTVYVAFADPASAWLLTVKRLDAGAGAWALVGRTPGISGWPCSSPSLALTPSGALLAAYRIDSFTADQSTPAAAVLRFGGGAWAALGRPYLAGDQLPGGLSSQPPANGRYGLPVALAVASGSETPVVAVEETPWAAGSPILVMSPAAAGGGWEPLGPTPPNLVTADALYDHQHISVAALGGRVCTAFNDGLRADATTTSPEARYGLAVKCLDRRQ